MDQTNPNYAKIAAYVERNPAAVLSTVDVNGKPHGAVVYVCLGNDNTLCFVTKNGTKKYQNLVQHPDVSLTFFNDRESSTLQADGKAFVADNPELINYVMDKVTKTHAMQAEWLPPITKVQAGEYAIIGITLSYARLSEFGGVSINGAAVTEISA